MERSVDEAHQNVNLQLRYVWRGALGSNLVEKKGPSNAAIICPLVDRHIGSS
jgi:hypothetical protein